MNVLGEIRPFSPAAALMSLIWLATPLNCATAAEKIFAYTEQAYPMNYTLDGDDEGELYGYGVQLVTAVLEEADLEFENLIVPWVRALQEIDSRENVLVYSMARTTTREAKYHWVGEIAPFDYYLYGLRERSAELPRSLADARDATICMVREDIAHQYLAERGIGQRVFVAQLRQCLVMLAAGRIDLFPVPNYSSAAFARRNGFDPDALLGVVRIEGISTELYMAVSKSTSDDIVRRILDAYSRVRTSGKYDEIMSGLPGEMADLVEVLAEP